jgi:hypothetical protein
MVSPPLIAIICVSTIEEPIVDDGSFVWHRHITLSGNIITPHVDTPDDTIPSVVFFIGKHCSLLHTLSYLYSRREDLDKRIGKEGLPGVVYRNSFLVKEA